MMRIGLSTAIYDIFGFMWLSVDENSQTRQFQRRMSKTSTLDGGATVIDLGYAPSDSNMRLRIFELNESEVRNLERISMYHSRVIVCTDTGAYQGVIEKLVTDKTPIEMTFSVESKLSA